MENFQKYNICICGGGNISHALAGNLSYNGHSVNILTRRPTEWNEKINVISPDSEYIGTISKISDNPDIVISNSEIIIISSPIYAIGEILAKIKPFITDKMTIIGIPGRLFSKYNKDLDHVNQIYLLRTPYISRINNYGSNVSITGYCYKELNYWSNNFEKSEIILKSLFPFNLKKINNLMSIDMVNSNTILHPARLYSLFKNKKEYNLIPQFYQEWDLDASKYLIECDNELQNLIIEINKDIQLENKIYVKPILEHYESLNEIELTEKIRNIKAYTMQTPMIERNGKYYCDYTSRYITEDILIGMKHIIDLSQKKKILIPRIEEIYYFFFNSTK